jgi:hypothetical protein
MPLRRLKARWHFVVYQVLENRPWQQHCISVATRS